jgi:hypothetical protein
MQPNLWYTVYGSSITGGSIALYLPSATVHANQHLLPVSRLCCCHCIQLSAVWPRCMHTLCPTAVLHLLLVLLLAGDW